LLFFNSRRTVPNILTQLLRVRGKRSGLQGNTINSSLSERSYPKMSQAAGAIIQRYASAVSRLVFHILLPTRDSCCEALRCFRPPLSSAREVPLVQRTKRHCVLVGQASSGTPSLSASCPVNQVQCPGASPPAQSPRQDPKWRSLLWGIRFDGRKRRRGGVARPLRSLGRPKPIARGVQGASGTGSWEAA